MIHIRAKILADIDDERERQNVVHPESGDLPDGTGGGGRETWRNIAQHSCDRAAREKRCTFAHVLDEETSEALAETDPVRLRAELVQVAAVAVRWLEKLDRAAAEVNRKREQHRALDRLLAEYLMSHDDALPSTISTMDLLTWSSMRLRSGR